MNEANAADPVPAQRAVSVILPTFNRVATLPRTIESVLGQEQAALELIIVGDGSTVSTSAVLECFAGPRVRVIRLRVIRVAGYPGAKVSRREM